MRSVLLGAIAATILAIGAYAVMENNVQRTAQERNITSGARL